MKTRAGSGLAIGDGLIGAAGYADVKLDGQWSPSESKIGGAMSERALYKARVPVAENTPSAGLNICAGRSPGSQSGVAPSISAFPASKPVAMEISPFTVAGAAAFRVETIGLKPYRIPS